MKLSDLRPKRGSNRPIKRRGCGSGSGHGKTSCRGHKGSGARSGTNRRFGFEGGQMPLIRRIPKRGFNSKFPAHYQVVNLGQLKGFKDGDIVDPQQMRQMDIIKRADEPVKVLADGEIKKALTVSAHKFSKNAKEKIEKAGGKVQLITKELPRVPSVS
jgi:large subunit ribosomal protein L15